MSCLESKKYEIIPIETYKIIRNCYGCGRKSVYHNTNKIRVNANGKQIDVWLIYQCSKCKHTYNLPIYSRINRDALDKSEYEALQRSNQEIVRRYGLDRNIFQKNRAKIFDEPAYILKYIGTDSKENVIQFSNPHKIRICQDKLIAECLDISYSQAKKMLEARVLKVSKLFDNEVIFTY